MKKLSFQWSLPQAVPGCTVGRCLGAAQCGPADRVAHRLPKGRRSRECDVVMGLGSASTVVGNFLTGPASGWSLAHGLTGSIFAFGAIEDQLRAAEAEEQQAPHLCRRTILSAFRETNDALVGSQREIEEVAMQGLCVDALFVSVCRAVSGSWVDITGPLVPWPPGMAAVTSLQSSAAGRP